jgi:hypothetical protein
MVKKAWKHIITMMFGAQVVLHKWNGLPSLCAKPFFTLFDAVIRILITICGSMEFNHSVLQTLIRVYTEYNQCFCRFFKL